MNSSSLSRATLQSKSLAKIELLRRQSKKYGFKWFVNNVFCLSFGGDWLAGDYINDVCDRMVKNHNTMEVTGRGHFKSTRNYAEIMYHIFTAEKYWDALYLSYSTTMAEHHVGKIRGLINANPAFATMYDHKPSADFILVYSRTRYSPQIVIKPKGLFEYKRGAHPKAIYVDDPYKDVDEKRELDPQAIYKVNEVFKSEVIPMVNEEDIFRVVGTPQTDEDLFFDDALREQFTVKITPSIVDREEKIALWPQYMTFEQLERRERIIGVKRFSREYMARPLRSLNSYIEVEAYQKAERTNSWKFEDHSEKLKKQIVVAGFDIGKKRHPSHLAVFIKSYATIVKGEPKMSKYTQIFSQWFDHIDYNIQVERLNLACEYFNISDLFYDNTRSEFESHDEAGKLHPSMLPVVFTAKRKMMMATKMETLFSTGRIVLCKEDRQSKQFLSVDADLNAPETSLGHGDAFWSIGMAVCDEEDIIQARSV